MPNPLAGDLHVDGLLSEISIMTANQLEDYIADKAFPLVYVAKQSDKYLVYDDGFFQADEGDAMRRAPGTEAAEGGYKVTTSNTYYAESYAVAHGIPDEDRANADSIFELDQEATLLTTELVMIRRERAFATDFMATGVWQTDKTVATKWSDYGGSDPLGDFADGRRVISGDIGRNPTKAVMGNITWERLRYHPDFIELIKYGASSDRPAQVTENLLAQLLGLDAVLVGKASYRSSVEGASVTKARILDDDCLLLYVPASPARRTPAAGYTFIWGAMLGGQRVPQLIRKIREDRRMRDVIECHTWYDHKATATKAGYFFANVVD